MFHPKSKFLAIIIGLNGLLSCRMAEQQANHRSEPPMSPNQPSEDYHSQFLDIAAIGDQLSMILALIENTLSIPGSLNQKLFNNLATAPNSGLNTHNPLDLLRKIFSDVGIARKKIQGNQTEWDWESLSGRRLLGVPLHILVREEGEGQRLLVTLGDEPEVKTYSLSLSDERSLRFTKVNLEELTKLYSDAHQILANLPPVSLRGTLLVTMDNPNLRLEAKDLRWNSQNLQIIVENFSFDLATDRRILENLQFRATIQDNRESVKPHGLTLRVQKNADQGAQFEFELE